MNVLIGCEYSGVVREAFRALGHDAWSCDLLPADDNSPQHIQGDVFEAAASRQWDLAIFHPPCTYLCVSGLHWNGRVPGRQALTEEAIAFCIRLMELDIEMIAMENPVGCLSTRYRKPDQIIQPYEFGENASKKTCLWLKNLPPLVIDPAKRVAGRLVGGKERWDNQTDSNQNKLGPSPDRWKERSKTYQGIANAFAAQWAW